MARFKRNFDEAETSEEINISPLIDVIFILLIFFVVTMAFSDKRSLDIDVPSSSNSAQISGNFANIAVSASGEIFFDSQKCSLAAVAGKMASSGKRSALVYADKSVRADRLVEVIDSVRSAGAAVYLATKK